MIADTRAQHLFRTQKMFLILFRSILCPQQMFPSLRSMETQHSFCVPRVCAPKKHHEQQCVLACQGLIKRVASLTKSCCKGNKNLLETREISFELAEDTQVAPNFWCFLRGTCPLSLARRLFFATFSYFLHKFETTRSSQSKEIGFSISLVCSASKSRAGGHNFNN